MKKYNITGMRGQFRYILVRDLSHDDAIDLKNLLNEKNKYVEASITIAEGVVSPSNTPIDEIIEDWENRVMK